MQNLSAERSGSPSALVVEDDPSVRGLLTSQLRHLGFRVSSAPDFRGAAALLAAERLDLVVTDLDLGQGREGLEVVSLVKDGDAATRVVLVTGAGSIEIETEAVRRGADAYLEKPWTLGELEETLAGIGWLGNRVSRTTAG